MATFYLQFCVFPWIEKFILSWILSWYHLGVAREMFGMLCWLLYKMNPQNWREKLGDKVTENWHELEDMENELDCDSNDYSCIYFLLLLFEVSD